MYDVPNTRYVTRNREGYAIVRKEDGKMKYYGYGKTLIMALMKLDWVIANGWKKYPNMHPLKYIIETPEGTFQIRKFSKKNGKKTLTYYGTYKSLKDAQSERDKLVELDWDIDAWCDLG